MLFIHASPGR